VTMHWADLILILSLVIVASAVSYLLLLHRIRHIVTELHLKIADQLALLDDAIQALEARLDEYRAASELVESALSLESAASEQEGTRDESGPEVVAPDIQAVIAAAAVAAIGPDAHIRSIKPATSSWSQQGRVLVQGSHNARARR
jgi:hypothetical protein